MLRIAGDPAAVRNTAKYVAAALGDRLSDRDRKFLFDLSEFEGPDVLSIRQREWLYDLRSRARRHRVVKGYRASTLIRKLWELRFDFSEEVEEFLNQQHELLKERGTDLTLSEP